MAFPGTGVVPEQNQQRPEDLVSNQSIPGAFQTHTQYIDGEDCQSGTHQEYGDEGDGSSDLGITSTAQGTGEDQLRTALRVKKIVTVPVMENLTRNDNGTTKTLQGIVVNLADYTIGADKGGAVNAFDDFDIDYNQMKYLIETRCSGALTKPFSAIVVESTAA